MTQTSPKSNSQNNNGFNSPSSDYVPLEDNLPNIPDDDLPPLSFPTSDQQEVETEGEFNANLTSESSSQEWETKRESSSWQMPSWWQKLSLRVKATSLAVAIGTIPLLTFGTVAYQITNNQLTKDVIYQQQARAVATNQIVSRFMLERYGDIQVLASLSIFANSKIAGVISNQQKQEVLDRYIKSYGVYDSIAFIDLNGNVKLQSTGKTLPNYAKQQFFQEVLKTGKPVISQPELAKDSGEIVIHIAAPVFEVGTSNMIGVVRSRLPVKYIAGILQEKEETATMSENLQGQEVFLVDAEGRFFVADHKDELGTLAKDNFSIFPQLQAADQVKTDIYINSKHKSQELFTYAPMTRIEGLPELNWSLVVADQASSAFAAQRQLLLAFFLGTGIATLAVAQLAIFLSDRATRPILAASKAVEKIGQGQLDTQVVVQGEDEIASLGANINYLASQIKSFVEEQALSAEQARLLAEVSGSVTPDRSSLEKLFNKTLTRVRGILKSDRVVIYRIKADGSGFISNESVEPGLPSALKESLNDSCIPPQILEAYQKGRVVPTADVSKAGFHPHHMQLMDRLQIKANLVVPVLNQGELYGLLIAHQCFQPHEWEEGEINFLKQVGDQFQVVLDRISFNQQRRNEAKRSEILKDITVKITTCVTPEDVFSVAVTELRRAMKTDRVIVYRFKEDWSGKIIAESVVDNFPSTLGSEIADPCFADRYVEKYKQGRVQATPNIHQAGLTDCHLKQLEPFQVKANLVAPILLRGELLGLLIAHQCSSPRNWEKLEIDFLTQIATQVGFTLERADILEKQKLAEQEQRIGKEMLQRRALELLMEVDPVSRGDLTIRAQVTEDEIGTIADSYNATIENLRKIVSQVQMATQEVSSTTIHNEESVRSLSVESIKQAQEITDALERIQAMTASIRLVAVNAEQAEVAVEQANKTVEAGEEAMNRTVDGIMAIRETVAETAKKVKRLGESSQKISKVVNLISSFTDQTNLLALNASIEAAHAGEEGRGFAVVADEVRSLSRQSAEATAEIAALVASIQAETNEVVAAMEAGTEQVVMGTKLVDETRSSLNQITSASAQINELVEAIARAATEQSQTSESVTQTMVQVAAISDKTSNEATQVSDSFKQLLVVAQSLEESVSKFKVS